MTEEMMGVDFSLDDNYNLIFNSNNAFTLIDGYENLRQAVINRLLTPLGSNPIFPRYGSYLYRVNSKQNTSSTLIYARQVVYESLLQEPRLESINNVECTFIEIDGSRYLKIDLTVTPLGAENPYNFVYDYFLN